MRKKLKTILLLLTIMAAMCMFVGCGDGRQDKPEGESSDKPIDAVENQAADSNSVADESTGRPSNISASDTSGTFAGGSDELSVDVESVGDNSVVGNKIFIESGSDGNSEIMTVGVGEDNKVLVTVYFAENASYVYRIIRNGGADVETRDGSFSDIKEGLTLHLTGYYKGEDFYADKVVISDVMID